MTLEERDQYAMLQADWSPAYDISHDPGAAEPYQAVPRADPDTVLRAGAPQELRVMVRDHHASRARAATMKARIVIVWLWQADGPGKFRGVTGDRDAARRAAARCITSGAARTATVEAASLVIGAASLTYCYQPTGTGWTARRSGAGVRWAALTAPERAAS